MRNNISHTGKMALKNTTLGSSLAYILGLNRNTLDSCRHEAASPHDILERKLHSNTTSKRPAARRIIPPVSLPRPN